MLLEKSFKEGDVITMKLITGEEILARYVEETDSYYKINKPRSIVMTQQGIGLSSFLFTGDDAAEVRLNKPVMVCAHTENDFAKQYIQAVTGLAL